MNGGTAQFARVLDSAVADSLRTSASVFRERGEAFSADLAASMIEPAEQAPALYQHWARELAERAGR